MLRLMLLAVVAVALSACAAQGPRRADKASVEIADLDLYFELEFLGPKERERFLSSPAELQKLVETLYFRRRMVQLADEFDYRGDSKLQALMRRDHEYRLAEWVPRRFLESVEVPDLSTQARAYYEANPEKFTPEKALHLQAIFLQATEATAPTSARWPRSTRRTPASSRAATSETISAAGSCFRRSRTPHSRLRKPAI
jgi:hypothetical protein